MIVIIDYGIGNLRSVQKAIEKICSKVTISSRVEDILRAKKLILPGVGHFVKGMKNLQERGLDKVLKQKVIDENTPILGICLGMQLMTNYSEEGKYKGLGWINATTIRFNFGDNINQLKIPHMGWNNININNNNILLDGVSDKDMFYFVHSYYVKCIDENDVILKTNYGIEFHSAFNRDNIFGTQFHPEKSHFAGLKVLSNFIKL